MHAMRSVFFGFVMLVFPSQLFAAVQPLFDSWTNYLSERQPTGLYSTDIDGDGDLDLVVCHVQGGAEGPSVVIFINDGAGNFSRDSTMHLLGGPVAVVAKDVERDGDVDIVTVNSNTDNITIFKNKGLGRGFEPALNCPVGNNPIALLVDSLNFDVVPAGQAQLMDVATVNSTPGTASILLNHGAAAFPVESIKVVGINPRSLVSFDMDNDGDRDLAFSVSAIVPPPGSPNPPLGANGLVVIRNLGAFFDDSARVFFRIPQTGTPLSDLNFKPQQVIAGDFNGDGFADLALADSSDIENVTPRPYVCLFKNQWPSRQTLDSLTFAPPDTFRVGVGCRSIFAADLDGDGDLDIAAANAYSGTVSILKNNGNGTFARKTDYLTPATPYWIDGGDYDRDGDVDLAVASITGHSVAVLRNRGDGRFEVGTEYDAGSGARPQHIAAADFDADGDVDFAIASQGRNQMSLHRNNGSPDYTFTSPTFQNGGFFGGGAYRSVAAADLDGDGDIDLAAANQDNGTFGVSVFLNNGPNPAQWLWTRYSTIYKAYSLVARDLDRDGDSDLAVACEEANKLVVLKNNGNGTFAAALETNIGSRPTNIAAADFDGDGDWDLATADAGVTAALPDFVSVMFNDGGGGFSSPSSYVVGSSPSAVVAADFDVDGDFDLAATVAGTPVAPDNAVAVFMNNGNGTFAPAIRYTPGAGAVALIAVDIDLDGDKDIVTADNGVNSISFLENLGNGTFAPSIEYGAGLLPLSLTAADVDNDGDFDLAVVNGDLVAKPQPGNYGALTILKNQTNSACFARGDLNGDGAFTGADVVSEINCIFAGVGVCFLCVTDTNCDSILSGSDVVALLGKIFGGALLCP